MATISRAVPNPRLVALLNPVATFAVNRGIGAAAEKLMILHWRGRKSGREFSTPITRYELDGRCFVKTRAAYRHNFADGHPCELVLDGERKPFIGRLVDDPIAVATRFRALLDRDGTTAGAKALSLSIDGEPTVDDLAAFVAEDGVAVIEFEPVR